VKYYISIACFLIILCSCKKDEDPPAAPRTDFPVSSAIKSWSYFKKGSYWIYKDSIDNSFDSVYVTNVSVLTSTTNSYNVENISIEFNDPAYNYAIVSYPFDRLEKRGIVNTIIFNPAYTSTTSTYGGGINTNYDVDTLKNVAGNTYANLRYIYYSYQYSSGSSSSYIWEVDRSYWKKNVGRIKKCPFPSTPLTANYHAYELVRYNVLQ
jgi:hypothetical protein